MDTNEVVTKYIDAWNHKNVAGLIDLMHPGAAYYDAFWAETCVGPDLVQYFQDAMAEEPFWYEQVGETISKGNSVVFRYNAHRPSGSTLGEPLHYGAEILSLRDGKILTITDIYCSADQSNLEEVAKLMSERHGLPSHANSGLGAMKTARIRASLAASFDIDRVFLDPEITRSQLAEKVGCTLDQLSTVIETQFGFSFTEIVNTQRIEYAKELLQECSGPRDTLDRVAMSAGLESVRCFNKRFAEIVGVTPSDYYHQNKKNGPSPGESSLH